MANDAGGAAANRPRRAWIRILEWLVVALVLALVVRFLAIQLCALDAGVLHFPPLPLLLSVLGASGASLLGALVFAGYYRCFSTRLNAREALILATLPRLGRYVPGKVHSVLGLAWLAHRLRGVPVRISIAVAALAAAVGVTASLVCGAGLAPFGKLPGSWILLLSGAGLAGLIGLHPRISLGLIGWLFRRMGREPPGDGLTCRRMLSLAAIACVQTMTTCGMFVLMAGAVLDLEAGLAGHLALAWVLASFSGFIAFFAPAGIGVQEGALLLLLALVLPPEQAAVLTVAARIWQTAALLLAAGLGAILLATRPRK